MSSRNRYLSKEDRVRALGLWLALTKAQSRLTAGETDCASLERAMREELAKAPVDSIDYAAIVDPVTMESMQQVAKLRSRLSRFESAALV